MVPIIDLAAPNAAQLIDHACRDVGFFAITGHGVDRSARLDLLDAAASFFAVGDAAKAEVAMARSGAAWRGWFPLGGELTSGVPDLKEGFYVGAELAADDPRPMHGPNLWPAAPARLRSLVEHWMQAMTITGQRVLALMGEALGVGAAWFTDHLTADPTVLFRIFRYPPHPQGDDVHWGVGEHTDYGLLTLLAHDGTPGLEVKVGDDWVPAPSDPDLIVCNLGDMLDRLTGGRYRSTPHRVRNTRSAHDRYSLPFFLDPGWHARVEPISLDDGWSVPEDADRRWDRANLREVGGTYGDWLTAKVAKVFPDLAGHLT